MAEPDEPQHVTRQILKELLSRNIPRETAEEAYRRGYRDGYIVAYNDMPDGSDPKETKRALRRIFEHWEGALLDWQKAGSNAKAHRTSPPDLPRE